MSFNPFEKLDDACLEAVSCIKNAFDEKAFVDRVLPGRTIPNPDELPASLVYFSEASIKAAMCDDDSKTTLQLIVVSYLDSKRYNPDKQLYSRGAVIWDALHNVKLATASQKMRGQSFDLDTDTETQMTFMSVVFNITL